MVGHIGAARLPKILEEGLVLFTGARLVQLVEVLGNRLRAFLDAFVLLLDFLGTRIDQQIALPARGRTDRLDDIVGPDRFLETVVDQGVDVGVEPPDAQVGEYRDAEQQNDDEAEAECETYADFEILEHDD